MIIRTAIYSASSADLAGCPESTLPEFALIGRSNVGKSSLINLLTGLKDLAKVSATPGKTRLINMFTINDQWTLVDLPGYGYAKVGKADRADFSTFISDYLLNRPQLKGTFVLIDSRLKPQKIDLAFITWMVENERPFALIFTKTDKISKLALKNSMEAFATSLAEISPELPEMLTSSTTTRQGTEEILGFVESALKAQD